MDTFQLAFDAIEQYATDEQHERPWQGLTPESGWGLDLRVWKAAATDIVARFNVLLHNDGPIDVPPSAKANAHERILIDFQRYLAAKADAKMKQPLIKAMES